MSSQRPLLPASDVNTTSTAMSDHGSSKGKAPEQNDVSNNIGFRPQVNMTVEPPKPEDLQKSYASIVGDDSGPQGWYGSMSTSPSLPTPPTTPKG